MWGRAYAGFHSLQYSITTFSLYSHNGKLSTLTIMNNEYGQIGMTYIRSTYFCGFVFGNAHMKHSHAKQTLVCSSGGYVYSLESIRVISM